MTTPRFRIRRILAWSAVLAVPVFPFLLSHGLCGRFRQQYAPDRVEARLAEIAAGGFREGVACYWSFDSGDPFMPSRSVAVGTMSAPGCHREAVRFNGHYDTFFSTEYHWQLRDEFSVAFWIKAKRVPSRQDLLLQGEPREIGFRLEDGKVVFGIHTTEGLFSVSAPFGRFGEFCHLAVAAHFREHRLSLYRDGVLVASSPLRGTYAPLWCVNFGRASPTGKHHLFSGTLDEAAIWNRALGAEEVAELARKPSATRNSVLKWKPRLRAAQLRLFSRLAKALDSAAGLAGFSPGRHLRARRGRAALRHVTLVVDNGPLRHLYRAHKRSRASGHRTPAASRPIQAHVLLCGEPMKCQVSLGGGTLCYPDGGRPSFVLDLPAAKDSPPGMVRRFLLLPPESGGWLGRLADAAAWRIAGLSSPPPGAELVTFGVNGHFAGVYLLCDASRMMVQMGGGEDPFITKAQHQLVRQRNAELAMLNPGGMSARGAAAVQSYFSDEDFRRYQEEIASAADILLHDPRSPLSAKARGDAIAESAASVSRRPAAPSADTFLLDESLLLGGNPCAWLLREDLDTSAIRVPDGWKIAFHSESAEWMDDAGRLLRRPERRPEFVTFVATIQDASGRVSVRRFEFRIAPEQGGVPALLIWTAVPFDKAHRTDATVELVDSRIAAPASPRRFTATAAGGRGGIRYRGNSSFLTGKRLLNIELDTPHHLFPSSETRSLLAINSYTDLLRVWSGLAFSLFRSFPSSGGSSATAPQVRPFELFCNGRYVGLLEFSERIDPLLLGDPDAVVFRHMTISPRVPFVRQSHPSPAKVDASRLYLDFIASMEAPPSKESVRTVLASLDLGNVIDYQILYSLFANANGRPYDFWTLDAIAYSPAKGAFVFIPWDFDNLASSSMGIISTRMDKWLEANVEGYREERRRRWRELRRTVLREEHLLSAFDALLDVHYDYLPSNQKRWPAFDITEEGLPACRERYRAFLRNQLRALDGEFAK